MELSVSVKPRLDELLDASLVVFAGRDVLIADSATTLRASRGALRPVLALVDGLPSTWLDPSWTCVADAVLRADATPAAIAGVLEPLARIAASVAAFSGEELARNETERRRLRALRWIATRDETSLDPIRAAGSRSLHRYGALEGICGPHLEDDLAALVKTGHLRAEHADRIYRCPCGDARLHFRDACEHCRGTDLEIAHVLKHRCGHAASSADFWRGEELACPSCGEELKVAGQDYEGPFDRTRCRGCSKLGGSGLTVASCTACGETSAADKLVASAVLRYSLTEAGRATMLAAAGTSVDAGQRAALLAAWKKISVAPTIAGRPKPIASLVRFIGAGSSDLDTRLDAALRGTDVAVRLGANGFVALLPETPREAAQRFVDRFAPADRPALAPAVQILVHPEQTAEIDAAIAALSNPA